MPSSPTSRLVATSHPLAVSAALDAWDRGGNAVDAAVAAAAMLTVMDPRSTGVGGDLFAQVWPAGAEGPVCLSAAGPAPRGLSMESLRAAGFREMPTAGPWTVTVPGSVAGWEELVRSYAKLDLGSLIQLAARAAFDGTPVTRFVAEEWAPLEAKLRENDEAARIFLPEGSAPAEGERFANPDLGAVLERIGADGADSFYHGDLAAAIGDAVEAAGGPLRADDLDTWSGPAWVEPISRGYRTARVYETPPPGQGLVLLEALGIYEGCGPEDSADADHLAIESMKLAFADGARFIGDPFFHETPVDALLSEPYLAGRRSQLDPTRAGLAAPGAPTDTVYVATADRDVACSLIQSLYEGFGSGIVVPGTGIALQNRGAGFVMEDGHVNRPEPGKRPYHTIIPAMLGDDGGFLGCLGVVGGFMQPQGQFQVLRNVLERGMDPQNAVAAPRFRFTAGRSVALEPDYDAGIRSALERRGHEVSHLGRFEAGGGQLVLRTPEGFIGGSDPRRDGEAAGR